MKWCVLVKSMSIYHFVEVLGPWTYYADCLCDQGHELLDHAKLLLPAPSVK